MSTELKFFIDGRKEPKKYAPAIFVTKQNGEIIDIVLGSTLESEKPTPYKEHNHLAMDVTAYWPASDYYKDGYYVLPEEDDKK